MDHFAQKRIPADQRLSRREILRTAGLGFGAWAFVGALNIQHLLRMGLLLRGQPHPKRPLFEAGSSVQIARCPEKLR